MDKKGKIKEFFHRLDKFSKAVKRSYLYQLISKFLSVACSIILVLLVIVGALMFYFNMKAKSYKDKGEEYTSPFGLYTIISGSMEPNVSVYDVVIAVDQDISKIKIGDIVTFISTWEVSRGKTVTHRVVGISKNEAGEYQLTTKGDNNQTKDGGTVTQNNLIGKVVGRLPQLGRLQYFLATKMGWFLIVFIPALGIIIFDIIKIFKLYVLKDQIEKVKTRKEALANALKTEDNSTNASEEKAIRPTIDTIENKEESVIDTVELPLVDNDGKIKENTLELPVVKGDRKPSDSDNFESIAINVPIEEAKKETKVDEITKAEPDDLPAIKSENTKSDMDLPEIPVVKTIETELPKLEKETKEIELPIVKRNSETKELKTEKQEPIKRTMLKRR